jgi:hypothetical protein
MLTYSAARHSGGVGTATVQLARLYGLRIIGTAGTPAGLELVRAQGAHDVLSHADPDHMARLRELTGLCLTKARAQVPLCVSVSVCMYMHASLSVCVCVSNVWDTDDEGGSRRRGPQRGCGDVSQPQPWGRPEGGGTRRPCGGGRQPRHHHHRPARRHDARADRHWLSSLQRAPRRHGTETHAHTRAHSPMPSYTQTHMHTDTDARTLSCAAAMGGLWVRVC